MASRYDTDITISESTLETMINDISIELTKENQKQFQKKNLIMKQAAAKFLLIAKKEQQRMKDIEKRAKDISKKRKELGFKGNKKPDDQATIKEYNNFKENLKTEALQKEEFQDFFQEAMTFNETILSLLEGKQLISLVIENSEGQPIILDIPLKEFFELGGIIYADISSIGKVIGRLDLSIIETQTNLQMALKGDKILNNKSLDALTKTYQIAKNDYHKHSPYAFWKLSSEKKWHGIHIGKQGDIAEAYSMFAHTYGPQSEAFNTHWEDLDVFFREGVAKVDNISGLYTSDITTQNGYSLAVKSAGASLPGFSQMIDLANKIIKNKIENTFQLQLKAIKEQYFSKGKFTLEKGLRNHIYEDSKFIPKKIDYNCFV